MKPVHAPRQERSRKTFEALLDAAEALGVEKTYDQISVQEIASLAGFTVGAFYARFQSKSALLQALMNRYEAMVGLAQESIADVEADERLIGRLAASFVKAYSANSGRLRLLESAARTEDSIASKSERIRSTILDFVIETLERVYPLPRTDLETAALLLVLPLRELHFKKEFWPQQGADVELLTQRVVDAVVVFLDVRTAAARPSI